MARRSPQLALPLPSTWGGRRAGAGRKPIAGRRRPTPHRARPLHRAAHPVHVTLRVRAGVRSLRQCAVFVCVRTAIAAASHAAFRVVQFSVQSDHLHLTVEAAGTPALVPRTAGPLDPGCAGREPRARPFGFTVGRPVPHARPHQPARSTPRVGLRPDELPQTPGAPPPGLDPCSSAAWFDGFRAPGGGPRAVLARDHAPTAAPRSWLGSVGWRRHGLIAASMSSPRPALGPRPATDSRTKLIAIAGVSQSSCWGWVGRNSPRPDLGPRRAEGHGQNCEESLSHAWNAVAWAALIDGDAHGRRLPYCSTDPGAMGSSPPPSGALAEYRRSGGNRVARDSPCHDARVKLF